MTAGDTTAKMARMVEKSVNASAGTLDGYDCPECKNRGWFLRVDDDGHRTVQECRCMSIRRNLRRLERSGLRDMAERLRFDNWIVEEPWQQGLLESAMRYVKNPSGWFFVSGAPGCGKTHICTAIAKALIDRGISLRYVLWRETAQAAKAVITDAEYGNILRELRDEDALYIDDFLKCKHGTAPTSADVNLAFDVINYRYIQRKKLTIISSEWSIEQITRMDEALGSRIAERCGANGIRLENTWNWRTRQRA